MAMASNDANIYKLIFESAVEGVLVVDSTGTIRFANPRMEELFGYSQDELVGSPLAILIPNDKKDKHPDLRKSFEKSGGRRFMGVGLTVHGKRKDDSLFPVEIGLNLVESEGEKITIALITDITSRKAMEDELEKSYTSLETEVEKRTTELNHALKEIKQVNSNLRSEVERRKAAEKEAKKSLEQEKELGELKSRFVTMASHEFRTPLSGILSSAALISKYLEKGNEEKIKSHLDKVNLSVHNLTGILNDFLSLEKLESQSVQLNIEDLNLCLLFKELIPAFDSLLKPGMEIKVICPEVALKTDKTMLTTVINNLVSNAIKYSITDSTITVKCEHQTERVKIEVIDEGIGIPEKDRKHLFDRFFRAGNVENISGTGLGLNIVKKQIEILGGKVSYRPNKVQGSIFTIQIPVK